MNIQQQINQDSLCAINKCRYPNIDERYNRLRVIGESTGKPKTKEIYEIIFDNLASDIIL